METQTEMIADLMNAIFDAKETMSDATYKALTELLAKKHSEAKKVEEIKEQNNFEIVGEYTGKKLFLIGVKMALIEKDVFPDWKISGHLKNVKVLKYYDCEYAINLTYDKYLKILNRNTIKSRMSSRAILNIDITRKNSTAVYVEKYTVNYLRLTNSDYIKNNSIDYF